ncbi:hypothetical protein VitviT2T_018539 [Vitis vinifera]|uniref:Protein kinase domain-containing protein n=1 Tax=Vitis vinifera TaxID=29760 RepID=A0ABY9D059_VITVI|nr:hypothetical protein VitviT2T_018539 [Vitis vinifera]
MTVEATMLYIYLHINCFCCKTNWFCIIFEGYLVDVNGTVKLVDFGLAKFCKLNDIKSFKGTAFRMAPEVINEDKRENDVWTPPADIWSLRCTVLEMLTWQHPYPELEPVCISFNGNK